MPGRRLTPRSVAAAATRRVRHRPDRRAAVAQARAFAERHPVPVRVCWDLDNTLVDSGSLLRDGMPLHEAIVAARPLPGMLELHTALCSELPDAAHFALSVRGRAMLGDTHAWLQRHDLGFGRDDVSLVRSPYDKPPVWRELRRGAALVVVDDLSHGHEAEVRPYRSLARRAAAIADAHVDLGAIAGIVAEPATARAVAGGIAARLGRRSGGPAA
jgi:hypothetical protein